MSRERASTSPSALVLIGHPVSHSLSPRFQNAAISAAGLAVQYRARDVSAAELGSVMRELGRARAAGNVTVPHKESAFALCARHTELAARVGAVNTFWCDDDGSVVGHNTDVAGVTAAIGALLGQHTVPARVALLGAGGSAASVVVALEALRVSEVRIHARTQARAKSLVSRLRLQEPASAPSASAFATGPAIHIVDTLAEAVGNADLVINATPIGLSSDEHPVTPAAIASHAAVLDLVYRPRETSWVLACRARGHRAEDGLRMLVEQGAAAFECWFGRAPDRDAMWDALEPRPYGR